MPKIDIIKENVQFEQLLNENSTTAMLNEEYLIPDTHPDVEEVLMVEAKPIITSKDITNAGINIEGKIDYNVLYLAREESIVAYSVCYTQKFTNYLELDQAEHKTVCEVDCRVEHIEAKIINERKVAIDGVLNLNWEVYDRKEVEMIKDVESSDCVEILKKSEVINKTEVDDVLDIVGKSVIRVSMDKPQISRILKSDIILQKKEIKLGENKAYCGCYCKVCIMYCGNGEKELSYLEDNVYISKELSIPELNSDITIAANFELRSKDINVEEDDRGESRIINVEFMSECKVKVLSKENIDIIVDAYSPKFPVEVEKENVEIGMLYGVYNSEANIRDNIYMTESDMKPESIITQSGNVVITDKVVAEDKIIIEGYIKVCAIYKTNDEEKYLSKVSGEVPFNSMVDAQGVKEGMDIIVKASLEDLELTIEANTIAVKALVVLNSKILCNENKELVTNINEVEDSEIEKKASITIYVVGEGDTLWKLAKKYNTTMNEIIKLNEIEEEDCLEVGEKLLIPGRVVI